MRTKKYLTRPDEQSSNAILKGSFDAYTEATKGKWGTAEVDAAFLQEIESWRELLAHQLAHCNKTLTQRELSYLHDARLMHLLVVSATQQPGSTRISSQALAK